MPVSSSPTLRSLATTRYAGGIFASPFSLRLTLGSKQVSTTALHCLTSLLAAASRGPGVLQFCVGQLLPGLIEYIARAAEADYASGDARLVALAEVLKAFVGVLSSVPIDRREFSISLLFADMR